MKQLAVARRAVDSVSAPRPVLPPIPPWEVPRSVDGKIARLVAELNSRPALVAAVMANGFPSTKAYARVLTWLNAARSGEPVSGMSNELLAFVREHETEIAALGFAAPAASVAANATERERGTATPHFRRFLDSASHSIRIVTSVESDYLQGFIDSADGTPRGAKARPPLRVLFLGNSLTYYHEMPRLFAHLAATGLRRRVVAGLVSLPGTSLPFLWDGTDMRDVLRELPWDVVVMQVRPDGPSDTETETRYVHLIADSVVARGGRAFVWGQYGGPGTPASFQSTLDAMVGEVARATGTTVAPIGAVWDAVRQDDSAVWEGLFDDLPHGDTHPSAEGSYLLALSFYRAIAGKSPVGLPRTVGELAVPREHAERLQRSVASVAW